MRVPGKELVFVLPRARIEAPELDARREGNAAFTPPRVGAGRALFLGEDIASLADTQAEHVFLLGARAILPVL